MTIQEPFRHAGGGPWASIDRGAIAHNLNWLRRRLAHGHPGTAPRVWAVVKADAYGHGLHHALAALGHADGVAVSGLDDVMRVRRKGWRRPVLLLSAAGLQAGDLRDPAVGELHLVVDEPAMLEQLERRPHGLARIHAWLRYAGRLRSQGFHDAAYADAFKRLHALTRAGALADAGHLHHYAAADDVQALAAERQAFAAATAGMPGLRCTGNSAALCIHTAEPEAAHGQWLRCGLLLYGASALPDRTGAELGLQPAMSLRARLLAIQSVAAGQTVGYGDSFRATHDTCIGVVGIGYGHGIPRRLWQHGRLLAGRSGRPVPLAGRVAMDTLTVDLGPRPAEQPGDIMTIWGQTQDGASLAVETVAGACDTIAAELLCSLTARVPLIDSEALMVPGGAGQ